MMWKIVVWNENFFLAEDEVKLNIVAHEKRYTENVINTSAW